MTTTDPTPVLCIPAEVFGDLGPIEGFEPDPHGDALRALLAAGDPPQFRPRVEVEEDPAWRQIVPYCVLWRGPECLVYRRGPIGSEERLHARYSIGVGGHVEPRDMPSWKPTAWHAAILQAARREILEETGARNFTEIRPIGLVATDDEVGRCHLGVVYSALLSAEELKFSGDLHIPIFNKPERILPEVLEPWSAAVLDWYLNGRVGVA